MNTFTQISIIDILYTHRDIECHTGHVGSGCGHILFVPFAVQKPCEIYPATSLFVFD